MRFIIYVSAARVKLTNGRGGWKRGGKQAAGLWGGGDHALAHLRRRKPDNLPGTGGRPASAQDAVFNARQDLAGLLKTFFGMGGFHRALTLQGWIRCFEPRQRLLAIDEHFAARTDNEMKRNGGRPSLRSVFAEIVATT